MMTSKFTCFPLKVRRELSLFPLSITTLFDYDYDFSLLVSQDLVQLLNNAIDLGIHTFDLVLHTFDLGVDTFDLVLHTFDLVLHTFDIGVDTFDLVLHIGVDTILDLFRYSFDIIHDPNGFDRL